MNGRFESTESIEEIVESAVSTHGKKLGALMPVLHAIQEELDCVPPDSVPLIAKALNRSRAEVQGVIDFYHDFRSSPRGRHTVQICRAEACQAMGARELEQFAIQRLGVDMGKTSADGRFTLEAVYCLGNCACSPSAFIDDRLHARLTPDKLDEIIGQLEVRD